MRPRTLPQLPSVVALLAGAVAICCLSLHLGAFVFEHLLDGDLLYPHAFSADLLSTGYPVSGWTMSSAPYFFPDLALHTLLVALLGKSGVVIPIYITLYYLTLSVAVGLCLQNIVENRVQALLLGLGATSAFLLLQFVPGHARYVAWLGIPVSHGSVLLLGFIALWLVGRLLRGELSTSGTITLLLLNTAMLASDSLFLFQVLLPIATALYLCRKLHPQFQRIGRRHLGLCLASGLGALLIRALFYAEGWFHFQPIIRYWPTPTEQWKAVQRFAADFQATLLPQGWAFLVIALIAAGAALTGVYLAAKERRAATAPPVSSATPPAPKQLVAFYQATGWASLIIMLPLPLLSCYWKDAQNARYLLNWYLLPTLLLGLELVRIAATRTNWTVHPSLTFRAMAGLTTAFGVVVVLLLPTLNFRQLHFPYPPDVAKLDRFLADHHLRRGLANSWNSQYPNLLSHQGVQLREIRKTGAAYFWNNNVYRYYDHDARGTPVWPDYNFILANDLREEALAQRFGEPVARQQVGRYTVLLYDESGSARIRASLEPEIRQRLEGLGHPARAVPQPADGPD